MTMGSSCNWTPKNVSSMFRLLAKTLGLKKKKQPNPPRSPVLSNEDNSEGARIVYH